MERHWFDRLSDEDRSRYFVYTTPDQLVAYVGDVKCTDPVTLARVAALVIADHGERT